MLPRLLLLEDNREVAGLLLRACLALEWDVVHAENTIEALLALTGPITFDALIVDFNLPAFREEGHVMSTMERIPRKYLLEGETFLRFLSEMPERKPKMIIAFSGIPENNDRLMAAGATLRVDGKNQIALMRQLEALLGQDGTR